MKNFYKFIGLISIMLFSFYYTEKIAIIMQNKSPIMQNINEVEEIYLVSATDAIINGEYIIPGINGKKINKNKSFINMKSFGIFNEYYLVFDDILPDVSLYNNKEKIINKGNSVKNAVAFIIEDNNSIINYIKENKIAASLLVTENTFENDSFFEQINNDSNKYIMVENLLNKEKKNTNICYVKSLGKDFCIKKQKFLIEESLTLTSTNIVGIKKRVENGDIILIKQNANLEELKLLIKEIKFKGLNIIPLSELISEKK